MMNLSTQRRVGSATVFDRACAVLCLLLLCFSVGHTVLGHGGAAYPAGLYDAHSGLNPQAVAPTADTPSSDTQDACALCAAMATAVPLHVYSVDVPQAAQPRPPVPVAMDGPVTGWHAALSCRPPPVA